MLLFNNCDLTDGDIPFYVVHPTGRGKYNYGSVTTIGLPEVDIAQESCLVFTVDVDYSYYGDVPYLDVTMLVLHIY